MKKSPISSYDRFASFARMGFYFSTERDKLGEFLFLRTVIFAVFTIITFRQGYAGALRDNDSLTMLNVAATKLPSSFSAWRVQCTS